MNGMGMSEDEFFEALSDQFAEIAKQGTLDELKKLKANWDRVSEALPDMGDMDAEARYFESQLEEFGINLSAVMLLSLRIAISKNEPPASFGSTYASGFILGYLSALEDKGEQVFDKLVAERLRPPVDNEPDLDPVELETSIMLEGAEIPRVAGIRGVGSFLRNQSREVGRSFDHPDADWHPVLMVTTKKGTTLMAVDVPENVQLKAYLFSRILPMVVRERIGKPETIGFLVSAWTLSGEGDDETAEWLRTRDPATEQIRDHPERTESLFLYLADANDRREMWRAAILRDGEQAPALGRWKRIEDLEKSDGLIPEMIERMFS